MANSRVVLSDNHPWRHRLDREYNLNFSQEDFAKGWLVDLDKTDLSLPAMGIMNGWGARYQSNRWYADELGPKMSSFFAFDSRGQGRSTTVGDLDSIQNAIDANRLIGAAFDELDAACESQGIEPGNKVLEGHCVGAMTVAALFAGRFPLSRRVDAVILISPVSTFNLPALAKSSYFLPAWFAKWLFRYFDEKLANFMVSGEDSEHSRNKALARLRAFNVDAALRQARQLFWKENVEKLWSKIDVPALMLVSPNDPLTKIQESADVYYKLKYPIWVELQAPDHLILEENIDFIRDFVPRFAAEPWDVYEEMRDIVPDY